MIFSEKQIEELVRIIDFSHTLFIAGNISTDILTDVDKSILQSYGIDWTKLREGFTPFESLFYFGRLASVLGPLQAQQVSYVDLKKYLRRGQFVPLSNTEKHTLLYLERKSADYIKSLGQEIKTHIIGKISDENLAKDRYYQEVIHDSLKRTVVERDSVKSIVSEIGSKTGRWEKDLGRVAQTELQNAYEYGKGAAFHDIYGDKRVYYKQVYPGACQYCIKLYLTNGVGSQPKLFTYQELLNNGTNIGRKAKEWLPVLGTVHPHCRCDLRTKRGPNDIWDDEKGIFVTKKRDEKSKGVIRIEVGDKIFEV